MKKITLLIVALVTTTFAFAQQKKNVIKVNPLSLAVANISLSYERAIKENQSFQLQGGYWMGMNVGDTKFDGLTFTPEYRFYVTDHGVPQGFYVAPFARYESLSAKSKEVNAKATLTRIGGGVDIGYQMFFGKKVTWDIFLGPKYLSNSVKYNSPGDEGVVDLGNFNGSFGLRFGTTIGIAY